MNKEPRVALGGRSKRESTRDEVLQKAAAERAARGEAKRQQHAAGLVQATWRSHAARVELQRALLREWQARFAAAAAQPDTQLAPSDLQAAVRQVLMGVGLAPGSRRSQQLLANGQPLRLSADDASASTSVRGTLALVLRSLSSGSSSGSAQEPAALGSYAATAPVVQALQLCQLCCLVTAADAGASSPVLDAAASRVVQLLATTAQPVLCGLLAQPLPLLQAARRCSLQLQQQRQQHQEQQQQQQPRAAGLTAASALDAALQRLASVIVLLLEQQGLDHDHHHQQQHHQQQFRQQVVLVLLAAPGLVASLPDATRARLLQLALQLPAAELARAGALAGAPAAHCIANIAQLLTGCPAHAAGSAKPEQQQPSATLADGATAEQFVRTVMPLLVACSKPAAPATPLWEQPGQQASPGVDSPARVLRQGCAMLGTQQHLLQVQRALVQHTPQGMVLWAGYCTHLLQEQQAQPPAGGGSSGAAGSGPSLPQLVLNVLAFTPSVLPCLWDWLARTAGLPLEAPLQASRGLDIAAVAGGPRGLLPGVALVMGLFCRGLSQLLLVLDDADLHQRQAPFSLGASRAIASTLNSLVFHSSFPEASGQQRQQPGQAPGQAQAAAAAAHPVARDALAAGLLPATVAHGVALLEQHAPVALRGLYDRDARKPFCQPNLWTEPYRNLMQRIRQQQPQLAAAAGEGGVLGLTAAIVQAMLVGTGAQDDGPSGGTAAQQPTSPAGISSSRRHDPAAMAAAAQGASIPGLRTGALLSLLRTAPQCVPFSVRLELFRQMLEQDKVRGRWVLSPAEGGPRPVKLTVRRDTLLEDAYRGLAHLGPGIKARLMVTFVNAQGLTEAGLDHGGLMKELLEAVTAAGTQPEYGLFAATPGAGLLYPHPAAEAIPQGPALLQFLGLVAGKALYEGILLHLELAPFCWRILQGGRPGLDDLTSLDGTLHQNLLAVKESPPELVEHLGLTFAAEQQLLGRTIQTDLLPGGSDIPVTAANRLSYCHLLADWMLNERLSRGSAAFAAGLSSVLPASWLRMFSPSELNQLVSGGSEGGVDVADMARYARYSNGYSESSHTVKLFWRVLADFTPQQRSALLRFVTSTSRAPLGGFKHLQPPLTIARVDCGASPLALLGGKDVDRLPSASTCFNTLKLPTYRRAATLRDKLIKAIESGAGFELS